MPCRCIVCDCWRLVWSIWEYRQLYNRIVAAVFGSCDWKLDGAILLQYVVERRFARQGQDWISCTFSQISSDLLLTRLRLRTFSLFCSSDVFFNGTFGNVPKIGYSQRATINDSVWRKGQRDKRAWKSLDIGSRIRKDKLSQVFPDWGWKVDYGWHLSFFNWGSSRVFFG